MDFRRTYHAEVLQSRRDRARRAIFWSRATGVLLMITVAATLRSEPELRRVLADAGINAMLKVTGRVAAPQLADASAVTSERMPVSQVKVNRPAIAAPSEGHDIQATADALGQALAERRITD